MFDKKVLLALTLTVASLFAFAPATVQSADLTEANIVSFKSASSLKVPESLKPVVFNRGVFKIVPIEVSPNKAMVYSKKLVKDEKQWQCLYTLWMQESGWQLDAENKSSGAYGIPQALPASKMESAGSDWQMNYKTQIKWGLNYIKKRYGSPCEAWDFHKANNWY